MHSTIHKIITGPRMANAWTQVNRVASQQLVAVLLLVVLGLIELIGRPPPQPTPTPPATGG